MPETCTNSHDGKGFEGQVVSLVNDTLTTICRHGKQHRQILVPGATVMCNGRLGKREQLQAGERVRVTTQQYDNTLATTVEMTQPAI